MFRLISRSVDWGNNGAGWGKSPILLGEAESPSSRGTGNSPHMDYSEFLKLCASGSGIVEIHHTITFFIATEWEHASFNKDGAVPYSILLDWVSEKELDSERERRAAGYTYTGELPDTYEEFSHQFSFESPRTRGSDTSIPCVFQMMEERPRQAVDWLFRLYASHYKRRWL